MKKAENKRAKRAYPLMPYLVGLFITVVALVLLSYLVQLRNKQELNDFRVPQCCVTESFNIEI